MGSETDSSDESLLAQEGGAAEAEAPITVLCGANKQEVRLNEDETMTIGDVREKLGDILNIDPTALAVIGDKAFDDDEELKPGDTLQFIKLAGTKG